MAWGGTWLWSHAWLLRLPYAQLSWLEQKTVLIARLAKSRREVQRERERERERERKAEDMVLVW